MQSSDSPDLWQAAFRLLEQSISPNQVAAWIQPLRLKELEKTQEGFKVYLAAPNDFSVKWVRDRFQGAIEAAFTQITGTTCELSLILQDEATQEFALPHDGSDLVLNASTSGYLEGNGEQSTRNISAPSTLSIPDPKIRAADNMMDSRYTFENFVVGASNQFAHASASAVAEQPSKQYNPLFIYSPPGLGKTHLLHAIGNHLISRRPNARVAYLSAEKFVNELIESLQHRRMSQFRTKYRDSYDMILIDDIQFIAGKNTSEEEFFHTFNALHGSKRQIVVTSDRPPKEIEGLEERVRTRFEWGLVADISIPEIETRIAILKTKAERDDLYLPDEVATYLASCIKSNVRELEGILIRLQAQASLTGAEISLEMAKQELRSALPEEGSQFTIESILGAVIKRFSLKMSDLKSPSRARSVAFPRQIAMYLMRKYTGVGFKEIGFYFGGKDHTTVMHAVKSIEKGIEEDIETRQVVEEVQNLL